MILSVIIVFPLAARSDGPVVAIITPPTTIESTASVDVAMSRVFPIVFKKSFKFLFVPPVYRLSDGLSPFGSSRKSVLIKSFGPPLEPHPSELSVSVGFVSIGAFSIVGPVLFQYPSEFDGLRIVSDTGL